MAQYLLIKKPILRGMLISLLSLLVRLRRPVVMSHQRQILSRIITQTPTQHPLLMRQWVVLLLARQIR